MLARGGTRRRGRRERLARPCLLCRRQTAAAAAVVFSRRDREQHAPTLLLLLLWTLLLLCVAVFCFAEVIEQWVALQCVGNLQRHALATAALGLLTPREQAARARGGIQAKEVLRH